MTHQRDQLVTGALAVVLLAAFMIVLFVPQHRKVRRLKAEAAGLRSATQRRAEEVAELDAVQARVRQAEARAAEYVRCIPPDAGLGHFLEQIGELTVRKGVVDPDIVPLTPVCGPAIRTLPIEMGFSGSFQAVHGFVEEVESLPRLARVDRLEIARTGNSPELLEASVTVRVYYQTSAQEDGIGG